MSDTVTLKEKVLTYVVAFEEAAPVLKPQVLGDINSFERAITDPEKMLEVRTALLRRQRSARSFFEQCQKLSDILAEINEKSAPDSGADSFTEFLLGLAKLCEIQVEGKLSYLPKPERLIAELRGVLVEAQAARAPSPVSAPEPDTKPLRLRLDTL